MSETKPEGTNTTEEVFDPTKIKYEGDELKKKYFETNQDIKKLKEKVGLTEQQYKTQLQELQTKLKEIEEAKELEKEKELEEQNKHKELADSYKGKLKETEKRAKELEVKLSEYEAEKEEQRKQSEAKKQSLLETMSEEDRIAFKDAPISAIEKYLGKKEPNPSFIKEPGKPNGIPTDNRMATEKLNDNPAKNLAMDWVNKGFIQSK